MSRCLSSHRGGTTVMVLGGESVPWRCTAPARHGAVGSGGSGSCSGPRGHSETRGCGDKGSD